MIRSTASKGYHSQSLAPRWVHVSLHMRNITDGRLLFQARAYVASMTDNRTLFPDPVPCLAEISRLIDIFDKACVYAGSRSRDTFPQKEAAKRNLGEAIVFLGKYVSLCANRDPNRALEIISAAGMDLRKHTGYSRPDFSMKCSKNSGELIMRARSVSHRSTLRFEISRQPHIDYSWKVVQQNSRSTAIVHGLEPGTRYYGRVFRTDKTGTHLVGSILSCMVN
jgi:hypothetical protein